jgi:hypothetical protein
MCLQIAGRLIANPQTVQQPIVNLADDHRGQRLFKATLQRQPLHHLPYGHDLLYTILKEAVERNFRFPECWPGAKALDASCLDWFFPPAPED